MTLCTLWVCSLILSGLYNLKEADNGHAVDEDDEDNDNSNATGGDSSTAIDVTYSERSQPILHDIEQGAGLITLTLFLFQLNQSS